MAAIMRFFFRFMESPPPMLSRPDDLEAYHRAVGSTV
jgi:hypothetical protein